MKRADSVLASVIKNLGMEDGVRLGRLKREWSTIFEKPVSLHTAPANLKEGELLINVDSPIWLQQLSFYKEAIIKKLHGFEIKTVRFKLGRVLPEKKQDKTIPFATKKQALTANNSSYIEKTVFLIQDMELRDRVKKAIEKCIVSKKYC